MELGIFVAAGNQLGETVPIARAEERIFGFCLVNDWSARDLQAWEYQPLGPFLAKNFATTISPWVVTLEALEPFRAPAPSRPAGDPAPLPYLDSRKNAEAGAVAVTVEVYLSSARMRETGLAPLRLSRASAADLYWTPAQLLAHHTSNGCNLQPGDLLATGTISGPAKESRGCHARADLARRRAARIARRGDAEVSGGRGRGDHAGVLRARWRGADRIRGVSRGGCQEHPAVTLTPSEVSGKGTISGMAPFVTGAHPFSTIRFNTSFA